mmetsp:Transcript_57382/g.78864  ORF Transcript_57382/g.78864 Transcript_57382/m.78864 type:complete len:90 (-) Transcript_57382:132-401(-)
MCTTGRPIVGGLPIGGDYAKNSSSTRVLQRWVTPDAAATREEDKPSSQALRGCARELASCGRTWFHDSPYGPRRWQGGRRAECRVRPDT